MANLAIKGHATRGKEVIEILEMLGGKNNFYYDGTFKELIYTICPELELNIFNINSPSVKNDYIIFTLEEFIEKFPYKVGDKVIHDGEVLPIIGMKWDFSRNIVIYTMKNNYGTIDCYDCTWMRPYKEETMEERKYSDLRMPLDDDDKLATEVTIGGNKILPPNGYLIGKITQVDNGVLVEYVKQQPKYPETFIECCDILYPNENFQTVLQPIKGHNGKKLFILQKLLICRDAYWKIASEQLELDKPWEPDWKDETEIYYIISYDGVNIKCYNNTDRYSKLAFPTLEMRDVFYKNFKDLIEQCKELL